MKKKDRKRLKKLLFDAVETAVEQNKKIGADSWSLRDISESARVLKKL